MPSLLTPRGSGRWKLFPDAPNGDTDLAAVLVGALGRRRLLGRLLGGRAGRRLLRHDLLDRRLPGRRLSPRPSWRWLCFAGPALAGALLVAGFFAACLTPVRFGGAFLADAFFTGAFLPAPSSLLPSRESLQADRTPDSSARSNPCDGDDGFGAGTLDGGRGGRQGLAHDQLTMRLEGVDHRHRSLDGEGDPVAHVEARGATRLLDGADQIPREALGPRARR